MPSSEDCIDARNRVKEWAVQALIKEGHPERSAEMIVERMPYDEQVRYAEKVNGPIYRGPYSPY